jgi:hypothetical protein
MNNLETWTKYDTYFIIVSCVISFLLIGVGLIRYSQPLIKFIFFGIVATLLFFLFRYLKNADIIFDSDDVVWHSNNNKQNKNNNEQSGNNDIGSENIEERDNIEEFKTEPSKTFITQPHLATLDEAGLVEEEEHHHGSEEDHHRGAEEEHDHGSEENHHRGAEEEHHRGGEEDHHRGAEEEHHRGGEEDHHRGGEEDHHGSEEEDEYMNTGNKLFPDFKKNIKLDTNRPTIAKHTGISDKPDPKSMKPYQSPVNITVSYITKNSVSDSNFAKDDIVSRSKLGTPDESGHVFNNDTPNPDYGKSYLNQKLMIDNNNKNTNTNDNTNKNRNNNENCIGSRCKKQQQPLSTEYPDEAYSNSGYSYVNPDYQNYNGEDDPSCKNGKCHVCPLEINQNWSKWKPEYLSGDNIKNQ